MKVLRLILGDQLNLQHSWFDQQNPEICYCMFEMRQETDYVRHHIQKVTGFFSAMRHFAQHLKNQGHQIVYFHLDAVENRQDLVENLNLLIHEKNIQHFEYQLPDEYRLDQQLSKFCELLPISFKSYDTEHFLSKRDELTRFFKGKKNYLMESFYRYMRRKYGILMDGDQPLTGKWNYDAQNRKKLPKGHVPPTPLTFEKDVTEIEALLTEQGINTIGNLNTKSFLWPTSREESLQLLDFFLENCLQYFGSFQDAMSPKFWALYHSRISFSLNSKMIGPMEVVAKAIKHWEKNQEDINIAQIEGFVRQIIGWREYMRGIYWAKMPEYAKLNYFNHQRKLPSWFWDGKTKMHCLQHTIKQSLDYAYAHHIQRLMLTGNFSLLAGIHPDEVDSWYLGIYMDAIEWVEITNTRGMSQFADGGIVGTKPYVSSANYIDKMSQYCKNCYYDKKKKTGERACPFNSLYWRFYELHREKLEKNPRISMMYRVWDKMDNQQKLEIMDNANSYLENIELL